jgi:hypothetical protein
MVLWDYKVPLKIQSGFLKEYIYGELDVSG